MVMITPSCAPVLEPISSLIFFKLQSSGPWICGCALGRLEQMVNLNAAGFLAYTDDQSGVLLQQYACIAQIIICLHYVRILLCMHGGFEFSHVETVQDSFRDLSQWWEGCRSAIPRIPGISLQPRQWWRKSEVSTYFSLLLPPLLSLFLPQFLKEQFTNNMDFVYLLCASMTKFTRYVKARLQAWRHLVKLREILIYHVQFVSHLCEYTFMWQRECSTRALCCHACLELNSTCGRLQQRPSMLAAHVCDPSNWVYTII